MALLHAKPGQAIDLAPLGPVLPRCATHAILKTKALELMRVVLRRGEQIPRHSVYGESTLLCIEGAVQVQAAGQSRELYPGQMVLVRACEEHGVVALTDSSLLRTVQLPPGMPGSSSFTD